MVPEKQKIKLLSLFSGYGTDNFALKKLGVDYELVGYSDIDKYANQCFKQNHCPEDVEDKLRLGDVTKVDENSLPDFDLLTGGFPCQAFSVAGKGLGELDTRGTLFYEIIRIAEVKKPRMMLLENVKGLTTKRHKGTFEKILSELDRIGYTVFWKILNTKKFGIPQNRERVFFVCFRDSEDAKKFDWPEEEELKIFIKDILESEPVDQKYYLKEKQVQKLVEAIQKKMAKGVSKTIRSGGKGSLTPKHEWDLITVDPEGNRIPNIPEIGEANRLYDSNGISPSIKKSSINVNSVQWDTSGKGYNSQQDRAYNVEGVMPCIPNANPSNKVNIFAPMGRNPEYNSDRTLGAPTEQTPEFKSDGCSNSLTSVQKDNLLMISSTQKHNSIITNGISGTLPIAMGEGGGHVPMITEEKDNLLMLQVPRGENPGYLKEQEVCPTLSGSSWEHNNFIEDKGIVVNTQPRSPDRPSLKNGTSQGGSGVIWKEDGTTYCLDTGNTQAISLSKNEVMNTLTTELAHSTGRDFFRTSGEKILRSCGVFRRLTPKECFRLQGFLDIDINLDGLSDTQIYKLAGNGQSLNVVTKLFEKMLNG